MVSWALTANRVTSQSTNMLQASYSTPSNRIKQLATKLFFFLKGTRSKDASWPENTHKRHANISTCRIHLVVLSTRLQTNYFPASNLSSPGCTRISLVHDWSQNGSPHRSCFSNVQTSILNKQAQKLSTKLLCVLFYYFSPIHWAVHVKFLCVCPPLSKSFFTSKIQFVEYSRNVN